MKISLAKPFRLPQELRRLLLFGAIVTLLSPAPSSACACGCSVFSVGARWMMATSEGLRAFLTYDYMDQYDNWNGWHSVAPDLNDDRLIRSGFYTLGVQDMLSRDWGIIIEAPVWNRYFETTDDGGGLASVKHISPADVRVMGMYTGISEDMSTAIQFGLKLPTGPFNQSLLDRDTQIGSGTTDLLLGAYQMRQLDTWGWFGQVLWEHAFNYRDEYRPGDSFDVTVGVHYDNLQQTYRIVPMLQLEASIRSSDSGPSADPANTGYDRIYISPGIEANLFQGIQLYANLRIPLFTHVTGYQLVAPALFEVTLGYSL
ncbi:MAG TPA: hypothetical protein VLX91_08940 [Candidatus Acidoferrales bacterium]|nr:hypothetical protein [Candidatus Acidoferrales bacterium]